jgi:hypothetical protein
MGLRSKVRKYVINKKYPMSLYAPNAFVEPDKLIEITSAWKGLEMIIEDIIRRFDIGRESCIEFGVEFGYSTVALSNYFKRVIGIDIFIGDEHTDFKGDHYEKTKASLKAFNNITLVKTDYKDWINTDTEIYDFSHVDIVHTFEDTFKCGLWAAQHSKCTIFHDTESFLEVKKAVYEIAKVTGKRVFNYPHHNGLGIIV